MSEEKISTEPTSMRQCEIQRYIDLQTKTYDTISFLKNLAGSELYYNDFKEAIIRLEGYYRGMKLADYHQEQIVHQAGMEGQK
jgi:phosphopantetheine adenylyltransferase